MTPNLLPLYVASFLLVGLLLAFARHNRTTGWLRERKSVFEDLTMLRMIWEEVDELEAGAPVEATATEAPSPQPPAVKDGVPSPAEIAEFAEQLTQLQTALYRKAPRETVAEPVETKDRSAV